MLKQVSKEDIKKWTELDVLGKPVKRVHIRNASTPLFCVKNVVCGLKNSNDKLTEKQWDRWLQKFEEDKDEYILIGDKDINNLYMSQPAIENLLLDIDYDKLPPKEIKTKRSMYTYLFVNPTEYNASIEKVVKNKTITVKKPTQNNRTSFKHFLAALKTHKTRSLPFKGICKIPNGMYRVKTYRGEHKSFDTIEEAAKEYDQQIYKKYGEQVIPYLNFPEIYQKKEIPVKTYQEKPEMKISVELEKYIDMKISQGIYKELNDIISKFLNKV
jgi:hypothetical protein